MADERSFMELDRPEGFQALQDRFSFNRRARPPPLFHLQDNDSNRVPLKQPTIQRRESKGGIRGIFTRTKLEQAAVSPVLEEPPTSAVSERIMKTVVQSSFPRSMDIPRTNTASTPATPATPVRPSTMSSRMNLRAKSQRSGKTAKASPKSSKSSTKSSPRRPPRTSAAWDPPPLFQAYPQAIKHATLLASTLSADAILRLNNHKRSKSLRDEIAQTRGIKGAPSDGPGKKVDKPKVKHQRQISGSISKADWTQKIFVLVTSGYLLQYSGDGSFDRLPEKMLQLTRDSVAFASDVIPGKHWVLQISQAMDADGTPAADSRSLLSRLAFRGADYRRTATSLLLILNSADDMDSWMAIVKREIEALGGKKQVSETGKPRADDKVMQLKAQPSHRYLVARDPDQFSNPSSPQLLASASPPWVKDKDDEAQQSSTSKVVQPSSIRPTSGSQSMTNSITSQDGRQLESLRDSNRFSYMSSGQRTLITSRDSSPATSPTRNSAPSFDEAPKVSKEDIRPRPNASAINERRRSMQTFHVPILDPQATPKNYRHSAYGGATKTTRGHSPGTPNFSVPNSSTKRHSTMERPMIQSPPHPAITSLPRSPRDSKRYSIIKGVRKSPPRALNVTRPLSPVKDSISPKQAPKQVTTIIRHRNSTFEILQKNKPAITDAPARSPGPHTPSPTGEVPHRPVELSVLMSPTSPESEQVDLQIPERSAARPRHPLLPAEQISSDNSTMTLILNTVKEIDNDVSPPIPILANTKSKMTRPISIQIPMPTTPTMTTDGRTSSQDARTHSSPVSSRTWPSPSISTNQTPNSGRPFSITSPASSGTLNRGALSPMGRVSGSMVLRPDFQRVKEQSATGKSLEYRRSMPLLNMPPPAPPPDCALPPLPPPGNVGSKSPVGLRGSMRI